MQGNRDESVRESGLVGAYVVPSVGHQNRDAVAGAKSHGGIGAAPLKNVFTEFFIAPAFPRA